MCSKKNIRCFLLFMNKHLKKLALICYNKLVVLIKQEILFQEEYTMEAKMEKIDVNVVKFEVKVEANKFNEALTKVVITAPNARIS